MNLGQYEALVGQLAVEIQRTLISRGVANDVAADIVQDMFVKVLESDLVLPPAKLRPYLYKVAWSTYLDQYRRHARLQALVARYLGPGLVATTVQPPVSDHPDLRRALQHLRPRDQTLLVHRYVDQWSVEQIATAMAITPGAVKMRLHRVHRKLRKQIRGLEHDE
ncbi:RNA polymerase sigma factor [Levilactobacillus spicheri]|uniref:RNA polymerase sigma factor 70 region 4 type 2 domain-containing protein n=1 Tax=Levilactobacillus spicheri TaxID=216463 RepID=A0A0F3RRZ6_9LACO|nr:RNA polymerase sigma factor [Levilactobacillus spicheri]KJW12374.1 hypothetical protein VC81_07625 [Levilactobacillus spicheri]